MRMRVGLRFAFSSGLRSSVGEPSAEMEGKDDANDAGLREGNSVSMGRRRRKADREARHVPRAEHQLSRRVFPTRLVWFSTSLMILAAHNIGSKRFTRSEGS